MSSRSSFVAKPINFELPEPVENLFRLWLFLHARDRQRRPAAVYLISSALYLHADRMRKELEEYARVQGKSVENLWDEILERDEEESKEDRLQLYAEILKREGYTVKPPRS